MFDRISVESIEVTSYPEKTIACLQHMNTRKMEDKHKEMTSKEKL